MGLPLLPLLEQVITDKTKQFRKLQIGKMVLVSLGDPGKGALITDPSLIGPSLLDHGQGGF